MAICLGVISHWSTFKKKKLNGFHIGNYIYSPDPMQHTWATCHTDPKCDCYSIFKSLSWKAEKNDNMAALYGQTDMLRILSRGLILSFNVMICVTLSLLVLKVVFCP